MAALVNDEEYADLALEAQERQGGEEENAGPSLAVWSPELDALAQINDKMAMLIELQKTKPSKPIPYARPKTVLSKARSERQLQKRRDLHDRLTAQLVPNAGP